MITLYKRNAQGKPIRWGIYASDNGYICVEYGLYGGTVHTESIKPTQKSIDVEIKSMINAKRKEGYKSIEDMYDNSPTRITASATPRRKNGDIEEQYLYSYLQTYLLLNNLLIRL